VGFAGAAGRGSLQSVGLLTRNGRLGYLPETNRASSRFAQQQTRHARCASIAHDFSLFAFEERVGARPATMSE